jgi:hypothetical protein
VAIQKLLRKVIMINEFLTNESFELPLITGFKLYGDFTDNEKLLFKWNAGGNLASIAKGPAISNGQAGFNFPAFINGEQALAMQSTSFIEQSIYLDVGTYVFSMYHISRNGTDNNPLKISLGGKLLTTLNQVVTNWTLFTYTFNVLEAGNKLIRIEGTATTDLTTGIDLVALALKPFFQDVSPFIWLKFDDGDVSGNKLKNYGTQNIDATLNASDSGSVIPNILTTGQIRGDGCINLVATGNVNNNPKGGFISLSSIQIPSTGFTISQWFKASSVNNTARLFDFSLSPGGGSVILAQFLNNKTISTYTDPQNINKQANTQNAFTDNIFHHYLWTVSQNGDWRVYIDNVLLVNENIGYPRLTNRINNYLGKSSFTGDSYFNGQYDDFRYYERTLNSKEVNILYNDFPKRMNTDYENLLENKPPFAIFRAKDYNVTNKTIPEARGKSITATTSGTITVGDASGNGATASIPFLSGNKQTIINLNINVPSLFTMCSITRWTTEIELQRIISVNDTSVNFIHGHEDQRRGICVYNEQLTDFSLGNRGNGVITDWLVMCGKNNSQPSRNCLADNNKVGLNSGGTGGQSGLGINVFRPSNFAFNQILVWDSVLTDDEMQFVSNYLTQYLIDGLD